MNQDEIKERVRAAFPACTAVADEYRQVFGEGVKLAYAEEGGQTIGRRLPESLFKVVPLRDMVVQVKKAGDER